LVIGYWLLILRVQRYKEIYNLTIYDLQFIFFCHNFAMSALHYFARSAGSEDQHPKVLSSISAAESGISSVIFLYLQNMRNSGDFCLFSRLLANRA